MATQKISKVVSGDGKKNLDDLAKNVKKMHRSYDIQLKKAKSKGRLRQLFQKHKRDHQNLLKKHLKQEEMTIKKLGKLLEEESKTK